MKSLIKYSLTLLLTIPFLQPQAKAQPIFTLDETNINETVQQIFDLYENQIGLSYGEVQSYLKDLVLGAQPSLCKAPTPRVESVSAGEITLAWNKVSPMPLHFRAANLDLNSGSSSSEVTGETQITYQGLQGLQLFAFSSVCGANFSGDGDIFSGQSIIIVDVDILFPTPPEGADCLCPRAKKYPIYAGSAIGGFSTSMAWPSTCPNSKYRLTVDGHIGGIPYSSDISFIHGQTVSPAVIYLLPWCDNNALSSSSGPVFAGSGGFYNASFSTSALTITLPPSALYVNDMTLESCACSKGGKSLNSGLSDHLIELENGTSVNSDLSVFPNPGSGNIQLAFGLSTNSDITLEAFDLFGKQMKTVYQQSQLDRGQYQVEVDTDTWPAGVYTFRLSTNNGNQVVLFSKN